MGVSWLVCCPARGHDLITTPITWTKEISRIVYQRCASCHRPGAKAFSLLTYTEARPWAVAIKEEVLSRRMPPWGAVKGFGDFKDDGGLSAEQIELIMAWVDGGVPEGERKFLPARPKPAAKGAVPRGGIRASKDFTLPENASSSGGFSAERSRPSLVSVDCPAP